MPDVTSNCPHCQQHIEAPDEMAGLTAQCPSCQNDFQVPRKKVVLNRAKPPVALTAPASPAIVAKCPSCGASLSETSVLALAPVCEHCGSVITKSGGTLGLTSAYGVNDPTITRKRVEADLAVFTDYRTKYVGMLEACKEQLNWGVERYAKLPNLPDLLPVVAVPSIWRGITTMLPGGIIIYMMSEGWHLLGSMLAGIVAAKFAYLVWLWAENKYDCLKTLDRDTFLNTVLPFFFVTVPFFVVPILIYFYPPTNWLFVIIPALVFVVTYSIAQAKNGERPIENARRQKAYESARIAELEAARLRKAAQDHRLGVQIRELDGLIETVTEKAEDICRILKTL